jgi:hypothetical protein
MNSDYLKHVGWRFTQRINYGQGEIGESDWIYTNSLENPVQYGSPLINTQVVRAEKLFTILLDTPDRNR